MTFKKKIIYIILTTFIALLSGVFNWLNQFIIVGLSYFLAAYYLNKSIVSRKGKWLNLLILIAPFFLMYTIMVLYKGFNHVLPISIISIIGAILGTMMSVTDLFKRKITYFYLVFLLVFGYVIMPNWIFYFTYAEKAEQQFPKDLLLKKSNGSIVNLYKQDKNKIIVLDFWSSTCASCIRYFPHFEEKYLKYGDSTTVFYTVNMPIPKRDSKIDVGKYVRKYKFTSLYAKQDIWKKLNIRQTPTYIILDKNFKIVYRAAGLKEDKWYYFSSFNSLINKLKND
ncbi:MAG: TlpA disulfide reductase family protein [Flavobacteriaceae bacterium]